MKSMIVPGAVGRFSPVLTLKALAVLSAVAAMAWPNAARPSDPVLAGSLWQVAVVGTTSLAGAGSLQFSNDQVTGRGPCNRFFATYRQFGTRLEIDRLGSTKMMCPGQMDKEKLFFDALGKVGSFQMQESSLSLLDKSGGVMIRLSR